MTKALKPLAIAAMLALGACSNLTPAAVSKDVAQAQQACVTISPVLQAAAGSTNAKVQSVAGFGNAFCGQLAVGSVPLTVDSNTGTWLGTIGGMLKVLLPVAVGLL